MVFGPILESSRRPPIGLACEASSGLVAVVVGDVCRAKGSLPGCFLLAGGFVLFGTYPWNIA
jgi:hypothetical protein